MKRKKEERRNHRGKIECPHLLRMAAIMLLKYVFLLYCILRHFNWDKIQIHLNATLLSIGLNMYHYHVIPLPCISRRLIEFATNFQALCLYFVCIIFSLFGVLVGWRINAVVIIQHHAGKYLGMKVKHKQIEDNTIYIYIYDLAVTVSCLYWQLYIKAVQINLIQTQYVMH